jgi:hypothetical protein
MEQFACQATNAVNARKTAALVKIAAFSANNSKYLNY